MKHDLSVGQHPVFELAGMLDDTSFELVPPDEKVVFIKRRKDTQAHQDRMAKYFIPDKYTMTFTEGGSK